jgi:hypothetical protein
MDPSVIGFGTIDDIDQWRASGGPAVQRGPAGGDGGLHAGLCRAGTVVRGNCTFGMFSNYPENVDDALRQRAGARFLVDGPQSREDYIDILSLLLGKNHSIPVGEHQLFAAQEIKAVAASFEGYSKPHEEGLAEGLGQGSPRSGRWIRWRRWGPTSRRSSRRMSGYRAGDQEHHRCGEGPGDGLSCRMSGWRSRFFLQAL